MVMVMVWRKSCFPPSLSEDLHSTPHEVLAEWGGGTSGGVRRRNFFALIYGRVAEYVVLMMWHSVESPTTEVIAY